PENPLRGRARPRAATRSPSTSARPAAPRVYVEGQGFPGYRAVAIGNFADPGFPAPTISVREESRHSWLELPTGIPPQRAPKRSRNPRCSNSRCCSAWTLVALRQLDRLTRTIVETGCAGLRIRLRSEAEANGHSGERRVLLVIGSGQLIIDQP